MTTDVRALKNEVEFCRRHRLDFYRYKAQQMFKEKYSAVTSYMRHCVKARLFMTMYGNSETLLIK